MFEFRKICLLALNFVFLAIILTTLYVMNQMPIKVEEETDQEAPLLKKPVEKVRHFNLLKFVFEKTTAVLQEQVKLKQKHGDNITISEGEIFTNLEHFVSDFSATFNPAS